MLVHTFDTCALSDFAEHSEFGLARHRLLDEVSAGRIVVLGTAPVLWELPGLYFKDPHLFDACQELLIRITEQRILLDPRVRHEQELRAKGPLKYPACVDPVNGIVPERRADVLAEAAAVNEGFARGLRFEEAEKAKDSADALDHEVRRQSEAKGEPFDPRAWHHALKKASAAIWYDQADYFARRNAERIGVKAGIDVSGIDHRKLPSIWSAAVIHAARVRAVMVEGTSPAGRRSVSKLDLLHLGEAAAYGDVFVTSDRRLRTFAKSVKTRLELRCDVVSLEALARRLTGSATRARA